MQKILILTAAIVSISLSARAYGGQYYDQMKRWMNGVVVHHPETASLFELGDSDSGEKILGLKIGNGPLENMIFAAHHGNEHVTADLAIILAASLAANPIPGQTIYIVPVLNIGGYDRFSRYEIDAAGAEHDPNRDFEGPCGSYGPNALKSTRALADFYTKRPIVMTLSIHSPFRIAGYPWGAHTADYLPPHQDTYAELGGHLVAEHGYEVGPLTGVIYPAPGNSADYSFWKHGIWSMVLEIGSGSEDGDEGYNVYIREIRTMFENSPIFRAANHEFTGTCSAAWDRLRDLQSE